MGSHNEDQPIIQGMLQDLQEILKWKKVLEKEKLEEKVENYIKTETIEEEDDNDDTKMESENEIEADIASENELEIEIEADIDNEIKLDIIPMKTISTRNEDLRFSTT